MKKIPLTQGCVALVDDDDYKYLSKYNWIVDKRSNGYYVYRHNYYLAYPKKIYLHREIMKPKDNEVVDHINFDGLDNRKSNLRIVTQRQNCQHQCKVKTSIYPGVCYRKNSKKFEANIRIKGKTIYLGLYTSEYEAFIAYKTAVNLIGEEVILPRIREGL